MKALLRQRTGGLPGWVLLTQLFIGLGWLRAATEKIIDPSWWQGAVITEFLAERQPTTLVWYQPFVDHVVLAQLTVFTMLVVALQLVAGLTLVSGRFVGYGLFAGLVMNFHFLAAGAVNPSAFYILSQGALALWMAERASFAGVHTLSYLRIGQAWTGISALISLPFVRTLQPANVIDDPAIMFLTIGALGMIACQQTYKRVQPAEWKLNRNSAGQNRFRATVHSSLCADRTLPLPQGTNQ
ncbi:MAG: hypothetical protein HKN03_01810 [Acidimicrobiales bacterium]|nr:hypothetical protein [Acidimicrobiales bacterium]